MARYTGPVWKKSRRLSFSVLDSGKEFTNGKNGKPRRTYAPGQHGPTKRVKLSGYGLQLREKQRVRNMYGVSERQFYNTFVKAQNQEGMAGYNFLVMLESRLDNLVYRMGFATTRRAARQLVIPSAQIKPGSVISVREKSLNMKPIVESLDSIYAAPEYVSVDKENKKGTYVRVPERTELSQDINEALIVEYYNR